MAASFVARILSRPLRAFQSATRVDPSVTFRSIDEHLEWYEAARDRNEMLRRDDMQRYARAHLLPRVVFDGVVPRLLPRSAEAVSRTAGLCVQIARRRRRLYAGRVSAFKPRLTTTPRVTTPRQIRHESLDSGPADRRGAPRHRARAALSRKEEHIYDYYY
jgi:hypothetical protein